MKTFDSIMAGGRTTGFDYLRLALATAVVCSHSIDVSYGKDFAAAFENGPVRPLIAILVPMFFALSGFLVAGSLERSRSILGFLGLRGIRLVPALAFETVLAALILGPLLTRLPLADYFGDGLLPRYFFNIVGHIQYRLPGMFDGNPWPHTVNGQLWTVPFELVCYCVLATLGLLSIHRRRDIFALVVVILNVVLAGQYLIDAAGGGWNPNPVTPGPTMVLAFLYGVTLYLYRDKVRHATSLGMAAGALSLAVLIHPATDYLLPLPAAYFTVWLGLLRPSPSVLTRHGDYSYGIFLFGFPVQQAVTQLMAPDFREWHWNIAAALPLTILFAMLSWHAVEKPSLALRGPLKRLEARMLSAFERRTARPSEQRA